MSIIEPSGFSMPMGIERCTAAPVIGGACSPNSW